MLWRGGRRSDNIEDRRGEGFSGGGGRRFPIGLRTGGIGGGLGLVLLVILGLVFGVDPGMLLQSVPSGGGPSGYVPGPQTTAPGGGSAPSSGQDEEMKQFVSVVLAETEDTWKDIFQANGRTYEDPRWSSIPGSCNRRAARRRPRPDRSTARSTRRSTSTSASSTNSTSASAHRATSPRPTSSPTRSAIMCRTSSASCRRSIS